MCRFVYQSQFEITGPNQKAAYEKLAEALEKLLTDHPEIEYFGTELIEVHI